MRGNHREHSPPCTVPPAWREDAGRASLPPSPLHRMHLAVRRAVRTVFFLDSSSIYCARAVEKDSFLSSSPAFSSWSNTGRKSSTSWKSSKPGTVVSMTTGLVASAPFSSINLTLISSFIWISLWIVLFHHIPSKVNVYRL